MPHYPPLANHKQPFGLYHPRDEKENCGFGLIANIDNESSHWLVKTAIQSLSKMTHRGGLAADGCSGDGCGLLLKTPEVFFQRIAEEQGFPLPMNYAVGMVFLSQRTAERKAAQKSIENELKQKGLTPLFWRNVPVDQTVLGEQSKQSEPVIKQIFIGGGDELTTPRLNRLLFSVRKRVEKAHDRGDDSFYFASLNAELIVYKGLVLPKELSRYFLDLNDPDFASSSVSYHQRFSTNTLPEWRLAQPFRFLAHNGEINTIRGNRNWARARESVFETDKIPDLKELNPVVSDSGSDSSSLDNLIELLQFGGLDVFSAMRMAVPPAWENVNHFDPDLRGFLAYCSMKIEPWDGPAGLVINTGRYAVCALDRNGLRPTRFVITKDRHITFSSEVGVYDYKPEDVVRKGRLRPGQLMAVDLFSHQVLNTNEIDTRLKSKNPYRKWMENGIAHLKNDGTDEERYLTMSAEDAFIYQKYFQVTFEEKDQVVRVLAEIGQEAIGSMGDDAPLPVLSTKVRSLYDNFRQMFAQVTNPPIDPLRESIVMSLNTLLGKEQNVFLTSPLHASRLSLGSPILTPGEFNEILAFSKGGAQGMKENYSHEKFYLHYNPNQKSLKQAVEGLCGLVETSAKNGITIVCLSDNQIDKGSISIPAAIATGAVHHHLTRNGLRCQVNLLVETATTRDPHHFAVLLGFGATAIYPYLAYEVLKDMQRTAELDRKVALIHWMENYRDGIKKGLYKIMSKMGISTVSSYRGAQLFEIVGLDSEVTELCFTGTTSRVEGFGFADIQRDSSTLAQEAFSPRKSLQPGGLLKYMNGGEDHAFNPDVVNSLRRAVSTGDKKDYQHYADLVNHRAILTIRDLLTLTDKRQPIDINEVEPVADILKRFDSAGISLGALSPEAHEALAIAMNRMGARSNSGEGAEDPDRYGTEKMSKIKQVASGRFGVTPHYLVNAEVIQIKVAQGAKPGEGGQLPGHKVDATIAKLRHSVPGVTLISPPPHHDIYSIEDLAQLIFDLKQVNPQALVSVKLVSEPGVGTIAAGVAKAYADSITISGYDGGTGASPLTSVKYAGSPFELGVAEAHQVLRANGLRGKICLQADGGLKTGLDVIKAALLGAESFGFGTAPMMALGCKYLRICHLNTCAVGLATQNQRLRDEHYIGSPEMVMNYFNFVAEEVREWLAKLGYKRLSEIIGQKQLFSPAEPATKKQSGLDLTPILDDEGIDENQPHYNLLAKNPPSDKGELAEKMVTDILPSIEQHASAEFAYEISNTDRTIGARIAGEIARRYGNQGFEPQAIDLRLTGIAGQSFGAFNTGGLNLHLQGDANDYVGKGMAGGKIVITPQEGVSFDPHYTPIVGNTCLYGATGGTLFAQGTAGERFAVRNSGAIAVVEGMGDHACEYMTGGTVVSLGQTGVNFGAGMSGGMAFVLDKNKNFPDRINLDMVEYQRIDTTDTNSFKRYLKKLIQSYFDATGSAYAEEILGDFSRYVADFWLVKPRAMALEQIIKLYNRAA